MKRGRVGSSHLRVNSLLSSTKKKKEKLEIKMVYSARLRNFPRYPVDTKSRSEFIPRVASEIIPFAEFRLGEEGPGERSSPAFAQSSSHHRSRPFSSCASSTALPRALVCAVLAHTHIDAKAEDRSRVILTNVTEKAREKFSVSFVDAAVLYGFGFNVNWIQSKSVFPHLYVAAPMHARVHRL